VCVCVCLCVYVRAHAYFESYLITDNLQEKQKSCLSRLEL